MRRREHIENYCIENLKKETVLHKDFEIFSFEYFTKDIDHLRHMHRHNFYALMVTVSGEGLHIIDFEAYPIEPKRVFLINYGQIHSWKKINRLRGYVVLFTEEFYNLIFTGNDMIKSDTAIQSSAPYIDLNDIELVEWVTTLKQIEREFSNSAINYKEIICLQLKTLVLKYNRNANDIDLLKIKSSKKIELIANYKKLINQYYKEWKLPKLYAQLLFVTPNYLNSVCSEVLGVSATVLIKERVILEACRLLAHSDLTITQIAYELGFEDNSHFGKYFKSSKNETPDNFRRNFKK